MTSYAHHPATSSIVATWPTGAGSVAEEVAVLPEGCDAAVARAISLEMDRLSVQLWRPYGIGDTLPPDAVRLVDILRRPNLPVGTLVRIADDPLDEHAHRLGRLFADLDDGGECREAVAREIGRECVAVGDAMVGELTGRAQQAVTIVRAVPDPGQLARAHALLHEVPLGPERLFTEVGPVMAAIAAFEWLCSALKVAHRRGGYGYVEEVLANARAVTDRDLRVATGLLRHPTVDSSVLVHRFLNAAQLAAAGMVLAEPVGELALGLQGAVVADDAGKEIEMTATVLDPAEPGASLLAGILSGIQACYDLYLDDTAAAEITDDDPRLTGSHWEEGIRRRFCDEVRHAVADARGSMGA